MPGPCSAFQSVDNFDNRFYPKEKSTAWPLLFSIESVTKVVNRLKCTTSVNMKIGNFQLSISTKKEKKDSGCLKSEASSYFSGMLVLAS